MSNESPTPETDKHTQNAEMFWKGCKVVPRVLSQRLERERDEARRLYAAAMQEACLLATSIHKGEYQETAPEWEMCDTVAGIISQIDNQYAGVRAQRDEARRERDALAEELRNIATAKTSAWDNPNDFEGWAKSRARHTLGKLEEQREGAR